MDNMVGLPSMLGVKKIRWFHNGGRCFDSYMFPSVLIICVSPFHSTFVFRMKMRWVKVALHPTDGGQRKNGLRESWTWLVGRSKFFQLTFT